MKPKDIEEVILPAFKIPPHDQDKFLSVFTEMLLGVDAGTPIDELPEEKRRAVEAALKQILKDLSE